MNRKILGLDIRNDAVSAVLVESGIKGNRIEAHEYVAAPDQKDSEKAAASLLETLAEKMAIAGSVCVASFPADIVSYRNIRVPFKGQKKIRQILAYELEPTMPIPVEELIIDFQILKRADSDDYTDIIAASVEASRLKSYLDLLASYTIEPQIVTVGGYPAALRLAALDDISDNFLFVDIGSRKSALFIVSSGQICFVRSFPTGPAFSSGVDSLCADIQRTLSACEDILHSDFQPEEVFITGCGLDAAGLEKDNLENDMARILGIPVKRADLAAGADIMNKDYLRYNWNPGQIDNAFALAMVGAEGVKVINFRRGPFAAKKRWMMHKKSLIKTAILAAAVLVLCFGTILLDLYYMQKKIDRVNSQITDVFKTAFPDVQRIVDPVHQMRIKIRESKEKYLLPGETISNIRAIDILNGISRLIPSEIDVNLTRLVIGEETVLISGDTDNFNSVDDMKTRLEQGKLFKNITISSTNKDKSANRVLFKLKVQL